MPLLSLSGRAWHRSSGRLHSYTYLCLQACITLVVQPFVFWFFPCSKAPRVIGGSSCEPAGPWLRGVGSQPPWLARRTSARRTPPVGVLAGRRSARLRLAAWRLVVGGAPGFAAPALSRARVSGSSFGSWSFGSWACAGSHGPCAPVPWSLLRLPRCRAPSTLKLFFLPASLRCAQSGVRFISG